MPGISGKKIIRYFVECCVVYWMKVSICMRKCVMPNLRDLPTLSPKKGRWTTLNIWVSGVTMLCSELSLISKSVFLGVIHIWQNPLEKQEKIISTCLDTCPFSMKKDFVIGTLIINNLEKRVSCRNLYMGKSTRKSRKAPYFYLLWHSPIFHEERFCNWDSNNQ